MATARELRKASCQCSDRGLRCSAKWAAEQLVGLRSPAGADQVMAAQSPLGPASSESEVEDDDEEEQDNVLLAKSYFDSNEFLRAAHVLRGARSHRGRFLRWYSLFLAGEKRKDERMLEESGSGSAAAVPTGKPRAVNEQLVLLFSELQPEADAGRLDGFGQYAYGLTLRELQRPQESSAAFLQAACLCPCFWSAWTELAASLTDLDALNALELPSHWMVAFFRAHASLEAQQNLQAISQYEELLAAFPSSPYLQCQLAHAKYNLREFDEAQLGFEGLLKRDPYRLDQVDTYSNILYVKESKRALSSLAHACVAIDKYRPETCCVIGNYYSLKAEHEKAVLYFRRALKLNRHFLSAWTLMGHEYVELKNTAAAVDAYRHAVDINPKDYRAWYGLGQTYEILTMFFYALFYYRKATALRPYDARMWCAMAGCYKLLNRKADAIKCYQRAESNHDREGIAYTELARCPAVCRHTQTLCVPLTAPAPCSATHRLFREEGDSTQAAHYFRQMLKLREMQEISGPETQEALLFLANHCKDAGQLQEAQQYCSRLLDFGGHEKEEAKALLRDIRSQFTQQPSN